MLEELQKTGLVMLPDYPFEHRIPMKNQRATKPFKEKMRIKVPPIGEQYLPLVREYYGTEPKLLEAEVIRTFPTTDEPSGSQLWHRDHHGPKAVRLFVYLTDVDMENGPFCYIPDTRGLEVGHRITAEEMREHVPEEKWLTITGPKYTAFMADIMGYHRGLPNLSAERMMLAITYYWNYTRYGEGIA